MVGEGRSKWSNRYRSFSVLTGQAWKCFKAEQKGSSQNFVISPKGCTGIPSADRSCCKGQRGKLWFLDAFESLFRLRALRCLCPESKAEVAANCRFGLFAGQGLGVQEILIHKLRRALHKESSCLCSTKLGSIKIPYRQVWAP